MRPACLPVGRLIYPLRHSSETGARSNSTPRRNVGGDSYSESRWGFFPHGLAGYAIRLGDILLEAMRSSYLDLSQDFGIVVIAGEVAEWLKAALLKSVMPLKGIVSSRFIQEPSDWL